jgi:acetyltransferase EpsM
VAKRVICLGGQGDPASIGKAIADAGRRGCGEWEFAGFLNDRLEVGSVLEGYPILGRLDDALSLAREGYHFINAILAIDGNPARIERVTALGIPDDHWATFVHPTAYVAPDVTLSPGCVVMPLVCISPYTTFGRNCVVLQAATVGHNNTIGEFTHISAQACLGAYLQIGRGVHVGMNSTVRENLTLGDYSTLGAGSTLLRSMGEREIWAGAPAKLLRLSRND